MKLKRNLMVLATGAMLSMSLAQASGTRGGGHVIDVDSTPYLMDLVTKAVCDWKEGSEFIQENTKLQETLNKLARLDWYFAADLEQEISSLAFCMTGPLYSVPAYEYDSVIRRPRGERPRQAAYRLYREAFIDTEIYQDMNDVNRAMLIIHETMHSYLDMSTFDRALKLRSMVKAIDQIRKGEIITREKLHFVMEKNEVQFPLGVDMLERSKDAVLFLKAPMTEKLALFKKTLKPENLIAIDLQQMMALTPWDFQLAIRGRKEIMLEDTILAAIQSSSKEEILMIIDRKIYDVINPVAIAVSGFNTLTQLQRDAVLATKRFENLITDGFAALTKPQVIYGDFLILAKPDLQSIGVVSEPADLVPLLRVDPVEKLPRSLRWLPNFMIILQNNRQLSRITGNELFYSALGLKVQKEAIKKIDPKIEREKGYALERLDLLSKALVSSLLNSLRANTDVQTFEAIKTQIKTDNF